MRFPYAAALTLSLWYMLMPPISNGRVEANAPLQQWQRGLAFSIKGSCMAELATEIGHAANDPSTLSRLKSSICIAEDDPRLGAAKPAASR